MRSAALLCSLIGCRFSSRLLMGLGALLLGPFPLIGSVCVVRDLVSREGASDAVHL